MTASILALSLFVLAACSATYNNHGFVPPEDELAAIRIGVDTRETLSENIGVPTASGVMRDEAWFYAAYRVRNFAYRAPDIFERQIVAISFSDGGTVTNVERFGLEDGRIVQLSRRVTESSVQDVGFLRQILSNFGRINVGDALAGG
jgi:outer membrane protein assembly factor BamE (lipoprotein component of BamABCDE complex)